MEIQTILIIYALIGILVLFINCFIAGFTGEEPTMKDFREGLFWPITLTVLIGTIVRATTEYIKLKK